MEQNNLYNDQYNGISQQNGMLLHYRSKKRKRKRYKRKIHLKLLEERHGSVMKDMLQITNNNNQICSSNKNRINYINKSRKRYSKNRFGTVH